MVPPADDDPVELPEPLVEPEPLAGPEPLPDSPLLPEELPVFPPAEPLLELLPELPDPVPFELPEPLPDSPLPFECELEPLDAEAPSDSLVPSPLLELEDVPSDSDLFSAVVSPSEAVASDLPSSLEDPVALLRGS